MEALNSNSKSNFLQSNVLNDCVTTAVIESMNAYDEQATLLLSDPEVLKVVVEYCYKQLKSSTRETAMA